MFAVLVSLFMKDTNYKEVTELKRTARELYIRQSNMELEFNRRCKQDQAKISEFEVLVSNLKSDLEFVLTKESEKTKEVETLQMKKLEMERRHLDEISKLSGELWDEKAKCLSLETVINDNENHYLIENRKLNDELSILRHELATISTKCKVLEAENTHRRNPTDDSMTEKPTTSDVELKNTIDNEKLELELLCLKLKKENEYFKYTAENIEKVKEDKLDLINRCEQLQKSQSELIRAQVRYDQYKREDDRIGSILSQNFDQYGVASVSELMDLLSTMRIEIFELKDQLASGQANLQAETIKSASKDSEV